MAVMLISYDLNKEKSGGDREKLLEYIKSHSWARLSESSYAISTTSDPSAVVAQARAFLDANDNIYVIQLKRPYWGWGPKDVNDWLESNLTY